jgi:hypothetical protein
LQNHYYTRYLGSDGGDHRLLLAQNPGLLLAPAPLAAALPDLDLSHPHVDEALLGLRAILVAPVRAVTQANDLFLPGQTTELELPPPKGICPLFELSHTEDSAKKKILD